MAFDFQGDSNLLSEKQIKFISDVLVEQGFENGKVVIETFGKAGDNYGSNVKTISVEQDDGKTLKMIAKVAPTAEFSRMALGIDIVFGNETLMYSEILPKFRQLEIETDIPEEERLQFPTCYGILNETLHEIILLEDLRESDYIMLDRLKSLTDKEVRVVLNSFAKIHSLSFILREKDTTTYQELSSKLQDFFCSPQMDENVKNNFGLMEDNICSLMDTDRYKTKVREVLTKITDEAQKLRRCDARSKYSVINHGDSWTNNMLFKLNDIDQTAEKCMLIDYQLTAEKSPVSDFLYLIFSCTDFDTRSKYYDSWVDEYHSKLEYYLSEHGIKATYVYSKEKMLADLKRYAKFTLGWSMVLASVLCMGTEDAAKFKNALDNTSSNDEIMNSLKADQIDNKSQSLLKAKVQGIIDSFYDLGYCA